MKPLLVPSVAEVAAVAALAIQAVAALAMAWHLPRGLHLVDRSVDVRRASFSGETLGRKWSTGRAFRPNERLDNAPTNFLCDRITYRRIGSEMAWFLKGD